MLILFYNSTLGHLKTVFLVYMREKRIKIEH